MCSKETIASTHVITSYTSYCMVVDRGMSLSCQEYAKCSDKIWFVTIERICLMV